MIVVIAAVDPHALMVVAVMVTVVVALARSCGDHAPGAENRET
jgi:hypothetical protein